MFCVYQVKQPQSARSACVVWGKLTHPYNLACIQQKLCYKFHVAISQLFNLGHILALMLVISKFAAPNRIMVCICMPITFNNPLKAFFLNKKYLITIQTRPTQIVIGIFLNEKPAFNGFVMIICAQNQLPLTFCSALECNKY